MSEFPIPSAALFSTSFSRRAATAHTPPHGYLTIMLHLAPTADLGSEILCSLSLVPIPVSLLIDDLGLGCHADAKDEFAKLELRFGIRLLQTTIPGQGRSVAIKPESLKRAQEAAKEYWEREERGAKSRHVVRRVTPGAAVASDASL